MALQPKDKISPETPPPGGYPTVLLFGGPGAGKGTQGKMLGGVFGFFHSSSGDVFRNLDPESDWAQTIAKYSHRGELVPDDVTLNIWSQAITAHHLVGNFRPTRQLLVLDGIPRTVEQAKRISDYVNVLKVLHLSCPNPQPLFDRLRERAVLQNRPDDGDEKVIQRRWEIYQELTVPLLDFYSEQLIVEIDALGTPAETLRDILEVLAPIQKEIFPGAKPHKGD